MVKFGKLRSLAYLFYYSLDYLLGYPIIFYGRGRGELIIFDRYYYDYLIIGRMSLPDWLMTMMMYVIPKPDVVVYLRNDPDVILSRKSELTKEELERQITLCDQLVTRLRQGYMVETTGTPAETTSRVARIIIDKMIKDNSTKFIR